MRMIIIFVFALLFQPVFAHQDYCYNHTFDTSTDRESLRFSKENSDVEYGVFGKFKCLHCCAQNYLTLEWFKNGAAYPWSVSISSFVIQLQSNNQTICTKQTASYDSGVYHCVVKNQTHFIRRDFHFRQSGFSISKEWPKPTFTPRNQTAEIGQPARFYCEAFVGVIHLPDFGNEITWEKFDLNFSFIDGDRVFQENIYRDERQMLGSYLIFKAVESQDFGEYTCKIQNLGFQTLKLKVWLMDKVDGKDERYSQYAVAAVLAILVVVTTTATFYGVYTGCRKLRQRQRSSTHSFEDDNRKDVMVIYHKRDEVEALRTILQAQRNRCRYSFGRNPIYHERELKTKALRNRASQYKAILVVVSPSLTKDVWSIEELIRLMEKLLNLHSIVACIFLRGISEFPTHTREWHILRDYLKCIHYIDQTKYNYKLRFKNFIKFRFLKHIKAPPKTDTAETSF